MDVLDERKFKGTFFCTGMMATDFPGVVKLIHSKGHEIGCHSYSHTWLNKMSQEEVYHDTRQAVDALEQCISQKVKSYRAPAFSIGNNNKWVLEILSECGITIDASVYPAKRDLGGFPEFKLKTPSIVYCNKYIIKEFPICTIKLLDHDLAYSGGGYFRFFPLSFIKKQIETSDYTMTYFHIRDLNPDTDRMMSRKDFENYYKISGSTKNRIVRYVKSNIGKKGAFDKLIKLIQFESFVSIEQADKMIDWDQAASIVL